jgi:hypothetical protein
VTPSEPSAFTSADDRRTVVAPPVSCTDGAARADGASTTEPAKARLAAMRGRVVMEILQGNRLNMA